MCSIQKTQLVEKSQVEKSVVLTENQASSSRSTGENCRQRAKGCLSCAKVSCAPGGSVVKNLPANVGDRTRGFDPWVRKIP